MYIGRYSIHSAHLGDIFVGLVDDLGVDSSEPKGTYTLDLPPTQDADGK